MWMVTMIPCLHSLTKARERASSTRIVHTYLSQRQPQLNCWQRWRWFDNFVVKSIFIFPHYIFKCVYMSFSSLCVQQYTRSHQEVAPATSWEISELGYTKAPPADGWTLTFIPLIWWCICCFSLIFFLCVKRNSTSRLRYDFLLCLIVRCACRCHVYGFQVWIALPSMFVLLAVYGESDPAMVVRLETAATYYRRLILFFFYNLQALQKKKK